MIKDIITYRRGLVATPYIQGMSELDAQNHHANEDRKARNVQANWDRVVQTSVALISAVGAIAAAVIVGLIGIDRLSHDAARYSIIALKTTGGSDSAVKVDAKTGQTWMLAPSPNGLTWRAVSQ
jgi:hypothetical protein